MCTGAVCIDNNNDANGNNNDNDSDEGKFMTAYALW